MAAPVEPTTTTSAGSSETTAPALPAKPQANTPSGVQEALLDVKTRIAAAVTKAAAPREPRLVAVSKLHTAALVKAAYDAGHRCFGENYVQELVDKSQDLPEDIQWHFIGHLQSNKAKVLVEGCRGLAAVETVDSEKLANKLNAAVLSLKREPLRVYVQVNTSGEDSKSGLEPGQEAALADYIVKNCEGLRFGGLMTIGMPDYTSKPENFICLQECRRRTAEALGMPEEEIELSMGMSGDFEAAIAMGSNNVRVGSTIFGARPKKAGA
eukprot:CAMPEP_0174281544 /NCGR_PEP_ID=MMETSP0809-20121228/1928_1 /TAXON_ID=73025 ORGANISM="Eutreptiella gymnastica-like, Strain CCMP1594" /NCGR_SAMPLE_ID=MMETSP0809 /ASSEMBLY_ACC=CAM_ASM_000658 /LENGTH=267 /DNA_ID=CAMNT_0015375157 /DNA_START=20 /DNA_END=823 /DNA_ORIENTATION=+